MDKKYWIIKKTHKNGCDLAIVKAAKMPDPVIAADALGWTIEPGSNFKIITCRKVPDIDEFFKAKMGNPVRNQKPLTSSDLQVLGKVLTEYEKSREAQSDHTVTTRANMFNYDNQYIDIQVEETLLADDKKVYFEEVKLERTWLKSENLEHMERVLNAIQEA